MVVVQWAALEKQIELFAYGLIGDDPAVRAQFDETRAFKKRYRMFRDLIDQRVIEPFRTQLLSVMDKVGEVQQSRDRIVHGSWGDDSAEPPADPTISTASHVFNWVKGKQAFDRKMTYLDIVNVAKIIDEIKYLMLNVLVTATGRPQQFLMSDALQKIRRKQDPGP